MVVAKILVVFCKVIFFEPKKILLGKAIFRDSTLNEHLWTLPYIPGKRRIDTDLFILISSRTFSAAEAFAYDLQQIKRATIVGETSKGGAHPIDVVIVKDDILCQIPIGYSENPITKTNWESVGVKPDIEVDSKKALVIAQIKAIEEIIKKTGDEDYIIELQSKISSLKYKQ